MKLHLSIIKIYRFEKSFHRLTVIWVHIYGLEVDLREEKKESELQYSLER